MRTWYLIEIDGCSRRVTSLKPSNDGDDYEEIIDSCRAESYGAAKAIFDAREAAESAEFEPPAVLSMPVPPPLPVQ